VGRPQGPRATMSASYMGYDFAADSGSVSVGDVVTVFQSDPGGWALVQKSADDPMIWVPTDFIKSQKVEPTLLSNPEYGAAVSNEEEAPYAEVMRYGRDRLSTLSSLQNQAKGYVRPESIIADGSSPVYQEILEEENIYEEIDTNKHTAAPNADVTPAVAASSDPAVVLPESVRVWLESIGLAEYYPSFEAVPDYQALATCATIDEDDALNELCIADPKHVSTLVAAARTLQKQLQGAAGAPSAATPGTIETDPQTMAPPASVAKPTVRQIPQPPSRTSSLKPEPVSATAPDEAIECEPGTAAVALAPATPPLRVDMAPLYENHEVMTATSDADGDAGHAAAAPDAVASSPPSPPPLRPDMAPLVEVAYAVPAEVRVAAPALPAEATDEQPAEAEPAVYDHASPEPMYANLPMTGGPVDLTDQGTETVLARPAPPRHSVKQRTKFNMVGHPMLQALPDEQKVRGRGDSILSSQWESDDGDDASDGRVSPLIVSGPPPVITFDIPAPPPLEEAPAGEAAAEAAADGGGADTAAAGVVPQRQAKAPNAAPRPVSRVMNLPTNFGSGGGGGIQRGKKERASVQAIRNTKIASSNSVKDSIAAALAAGPQFVPTSGGLKSSDEPVAARRKPAEPKKAPPVAPRRKKKAEDVAKLEAQIMIEQRVLEGANKVLEAYAKKGKIPKKGKDANAYKKAELMARDALGRLQALRSALNDT